MEPQPPIALGLDADLPKDIKAPRGYTLRALAWFLCIVLGVAGYMLLIRYVPLPTMRSVWIYVWPALLIGWLGWLAYRTIRRFIGNKAVGKLPKKLGPEAGRLRIAGKGKLLAPYIALGPVADEPFEPVIMFAPRITEMPAGGTAVLVITTIVVAGLIEVLRQTTTLPLLRPGWITVMAGVAVGVGVQMLIWPTYLRITPGRLDVMRFTLGRRKPHVTTVNLRNAEILANFNKSAVIIRPVPPPPPLPAQPPAEGEPAPSPPPPPAPQPWITLNLRGVWRPAEVVHAVMRGTLSTAPTPPLPDDQLTG